MYARNRAIFLLLLVLALAIFGSQGIRIFLDSKGDQPMSNLETSINEKFLEENANQEGVMVLASGLQYTIIKSGNGKTPTLQDLVTVHYRGTFIDGNVFDSSYDRGEPIRFPVSGVIAGWTEALQLMKEGDQWKLFIPAHLAYGETGAGGVIPPSATLIFEVELLEVH